MVHCWDEYLAKVHKAVPVDPWATNVQLLDVFIHERTSSTWLPAWLHKEKAQMARVGSMLTLGIRDPPKQKVIANADGGTASLQSINKNGTSAGLQASENNVNGGGTVPVLQLVNNNFDGPATLSQLLKNNGTALMQPMVNNNASGVPGLTQPKINDNATQVSPNINDVNIDTAHLAQPVDISIAKDASANSQRIYQKADSNVTPLPNHNDANNTIDRGISAHPPQRIHENLDSGEVPIYSSLLIKTSSMPDIQTSIRSSTSLLASFTGGSAVTGQFDAKGSKNVTCNVGGVKSQWVDMDTLMELVTPRPSSGLPALWRPDISLPQLQWSSKRGQTLWVVIEIMYANNIKIETDNQAQANAKAKASKGEDVNVSGEVGVERDGVWTVIAAKDNPAFPFALRLLKMDYDACGSVVTTKNKEPLRRNNSLNNRIKRLSSKHVDELYRSSSISRILS